MSRATRVDDGETAMAQADAPSVVINHTGSPDALVVATAMLDRLQHVATWRSESALIIPAIPHIKNARGRMHAVPRR